MPTAVAEPLVPTAASVQINGDAQFDGETLVLTDAASELSSVWYKTAVSLAEPFRVTFSYRAEVPLFSFAAPGGFGLVLQAAPTGFATLGQAGDPGHGYGGIANSLGLIVDLDAETLRLVENGGGEALLNRTDWNLRDANGVWEHGTPGYPLAAGVDPDATPPLCQFDLILLSGSCTVGDTVVSFAADQGGLTRLYDHYYLGHGISSGSDVPGVADGDWLPFEATFLPNVVDGDGSIAVLYRFGGAANGAGYLGVPDYFYLPASPIPADGSFFAGLPEYTPTTSSPYYVGFTASTGSGFSYAEQSIREWRIETDIENNYLDYVRPGAAAAPDLAPPSTDSVPPTSEPNPPPGDDTDGGSTRTTTTDRATRGGAGNNTPERGTRGGGAPATTSTTVQPGAGSQCCDEVPNPAMRGRLGRIVVQFPQEVSSRIDVFRAGETQSIAGGYGDDAYDLFPGTYEVVISGKRVAGVTVRSGHDTEIKVGLLRVNLSDGTRVDVVERAGGRRLTGGFGTDVYGLPIGEVGVAVAGQTEMVVIQAGQVTEF